MIYIACDMNCNNYGNFFKIIAHVREVKYDSSSIIFDGGHYPLNSCYRCKPPHPIKETFAYSKAIDMLHPNEYVKWQGRRFWAFRKIYDELQIREHRKNDYLSRADLMAILDILITP